MARITKKDMLASLYGFLVENDADVSYLEFVEEEIERLSKPYKPTPTQRENVDIKNTICAILRDCGEGMTATEVSKRLGFTVQKTTALLTQLVRDERVIRIEAVGKVKARFYA